MAGPLWRIVVYSIGVVAVTGGMIAVSYVLGQRHGERATGEPYESGIVSTGSARLRFSSRFYLVAMLFVIFDLESVFLFAWAVAFRELGWSGYIAAAIFIAILVAALVYEWRVGALDWGSAGPQAPRRLRAARASTSNPIASLKDSSDENRQ